MCLFVKCNVIEFLLRSRNNYFQYSYEEIQINYITSLCCSIHYLVIEFRDSDNLLDLLIKSLIWVFLLDIIDFNIPKLLISFYITKNIFTHQFNNKIFCKTLNNMA